MESMASGIRIRIRHNDTSELNGLVRIRNRARISIETIKVKIRVEMTFEKCLSLFLSPKVFWYHWLRPKVPKVVVTVSRVIK